MRSPPRSSRRRDRAPSPWPRSRRSESCSSRTCAGRWRPTRNRRSPTAAQRPPLPSGSGSLVSLLPLGRGVLPPDLSDRQQQHDRDGATADHDFRQRDVRRLQGEEQRGEQQPEQTGHDRLTDRLASDHGHPPDGPDEREQGDQENVHGSSTSTCSWGPSRQSPWAAIRDARAAACVRTGETTSRNTATRIVLSPTVENESLTTTATAMQIAPRTAGLEK